MTAGRTWRPAQPIFDSSIYKVCNLKSNPKSIRATFLGGLGDVGRNCLLLECGNDAILVDCGILFPDERVSGVDVILPDFSLLEPYADKLRGVIFTHGHEDHIGAAPYLLAKYNLPLYGSPLTLSFLRERLEQKGLASKADLQRLRERRTTQLGCFDITPFHVCHSIPDAMGFAIGTPVGTLIHTGDYMIDNQPFDGQPTDLQMLGAMGAEGVLALFADSTNADTPGHTPSQQTVHDGLAQVFAQADYGRVIVASFSSNLTRVQQIADLAGNHGRRVCVLGRSLERNLPLATELALLDIEPSDLIPTKLIDQIPHEELAIVCTGSQGEPGSALSRLADGRHPLLEIDEGDTVVISASAIPGNERAVQRMIGKLFRRGANVVFGKLGQVHVSGHPAREDTRSLLSVVRPQFFVPVHGSHHHLALQAQVAIESGMAREDVVVAADGDVVEISADSIELVEHRSCPHIYVNRGAAPGVELTEPCLRQRQQLANSGVVAVHAQIDLSCGQLVGRAQLVSHGLMGGAERAMSKLSGRLGQLLAGDRRELRDLEAANAKVKMVIGRQLKAETGLRPTILAIVTAA